ncbi:MAG: hypothetical protein OHK0029_19820 [Armatimonadaceae bacterium]
MWRIEETYVSPARDQYDVDSALACHLSTSYTDASSGITDSLCQNPVGAYISYPDANNQVVRQHFISEYLTVDATAPIDHFYESFASFDYSYHTWAPQYKVWGRDWTNQTNPDNAIFATSYL